jgi:hypothetical protein
MRRFAEVDCVLSFVTKSVALAVVLFAFGQQVTLRLRVVSAGSAILSATDLTFDGYCRMPTSSTDTSSSYGGITGRQVGGDTHIFVYGGSGGVDYPDIYELDVTGCTPGADHTTAPRVTLVTNWGDDWGAKRQTWDTGGVEGNLVGFGNAINNSMYWNTDTNLLYLGYDYNYTEFSKWTMLAVSLDDDSPVTTTSYGPWRFTYPNSTDPLTDGTRSHFISKHPTTGKMLSGGISKSGNASIPWGPSLVGGADFPTSGTTGGFGMTPINQNNHYLDYYYQSGTFDAEGDPVLTIKQFQFPSNLTYMFELKPPTSDRVNPAVNSGRGTWSDESSSVSSVVWIDGTNKDGVLFFGTLQAGYGTTSSECDGDTHHCWYRTAGNGYLILTSVTGTFQQDELVRDTTTKAVAKVTAVSLPYLTWQQQSDTFNAAETVTGGSSGATGTIDTATELIPGVWDLVLTGRTGTFTVGETVDASATLDTFRVDTWTPGTETLRVRLGSNMQNGNSILGLTSGATATITTWKRSDVCDHGCGVPDVPEVTGPVSTTSVPVVIFFDPARLVTNAAGSTTDYASLAESAIDMETEFGIHTADQGSSVANNIVGGYRPPGTNYLWLATLQSDCSRTGNCNFAETLLLRFTIDDSAQPPPAPVPLPVMPLAAGAAVWSVGSLFSRQRAA